MNEEGKTPETPETPTPPEAPREAPKEAPKSSTGMDPKVASFLCYLFTWLSGLIFYLIEKENKDIRFHAMQAILFGVAWTGFWIILSVLSPFVIFSLGIGAIISLLWLASWVLFVVLWILLMVRAYQGARWKLPVIGDMAERYAS